MKAFKFFAIAAATIVAAASCTKNFEEINTNPNKLNYGEIKANNCFESIIYEMGKANQEYCGYWNNQLVQYVAFTAGATRQAHMYQMTPGNWQSVWNSKARLAGDNNHMIDLARRDGDTFLEAVGMILKSYCFYELTALYGDVPYSECFQFNKNLTPKFQSQEEVLLLLDEQLAAAADTLKSNPSPIKPGLDPVYGDSAAKWRKFANTLRVRVLLLAACINDAHWAEIQTILDNPADYPVFTSNSDNATVAFQDVDPYKCYMNPTKVDNMESYRMTAQVCKMCVVKDANDNDVYQDPRLVILYKQRGGKWYGVKAGCTVSEAQQEEANNPACLNKAVLNRDAMSSFLMDYSELLFIEAEGVLKGKLTLSASAKDLYEAAVTANIEKWAPFIRYNSKYRDITAADIRKFLDSELGSYDLAEAGDEASKAIYANGVEDLVLSQKWFSLQWVGLEAFTHWRRVEYPILTIGDGCTYNEYELPTRFGYPNYTVSTNSANVTSALGRMEAQNDMHSPLDWSYKKATGTHRNPHPQDTHSIPSVTL